MSDEDLDRIRQQRMAQMQSQYGGAGGGSGGGQMSEQQQKATEMRRQNMEDQKNSLLTSCMDQNARARLNTLKLSKPDFGALVENQLVNLAQSRQLGGRITDDQLVQMLQSFSTQMTRSTSTVKFDRRRAALDSDDDDDYGL